MSEGYPKASQLTAFSTFHCGGGSTMGYKLAGFQVLGGVEIDPRMSAIYVANHAPKYEYMESIVDFVQRSDDSLPSELFKLDVLDGSPPCSTFSMAGDRA
jgi:DNA (cytosine-5)-methyltransferase 1